MIFICDSCPEANAASESTGFRVPRTRASTIMIAQLQLTVRSQLLLAQVLCVCIDTETVSAADFISL